MLRLYLGRSWVDRHIFADDGGYFQPPLAKKEERQTLLGFRVTYVAELLYNLQHIKGFTKVLNQLRDDSQIESAIAELEVGKLLRHGGLRFSFVVPAAGAKHNPDLSFTTRARSNCCRRN